MNYLRSHYTVATQHKPNTPKSTSICQKFTSCSSGH